MDDVLIFANPISGRGRGLAIARRLETHLSRQFCVRTFLDRADRIDPQTLAHPARVAIVIGGDGTLRTVADRLSTQPQPPPPILPIGLGTANLMVRHLGLKWDDQTLEASVYDAITTRRILPLDAGRVNGKLFLLMVGIGFDGHVVHELDRLRSGPITLASYVEPVAMALGGFRFQPLRVTVDGKEAWPVQSGLAFVGNIREYATIFPVIPHARPDDGLLDVCLLPCESRPDLIRLFLQAITGEHVLSEGAVYLRGKSIRIESARPVPIQVDGDAAGHTPAVIDLLPFRLPFIVRDAS